MDRTVEKSDQLGMGGDGTRDERMHDTITKVGSLLDRICARSTAERAAMLR